MNTTVNRLTWLSYLVFMMMGCIFISQGVLILYVSKTYNMSIAHIGYLLFIPSLMQAVVTYADGFFLDRTNLKNQIFTGLLGVLAAVLMIISSVYWLFIVGLFVLGASNGILISVPNYLIITLHNEDKFQKLNIINFFFSVGGILGPFILGILLDVNIPWQLAVSVIFVLIFLLLWLNNRIEYSRISASKESESEETAKEKEASWHISIYLTAGALFFYVLSECIFSAWIVSYFKVSKNFSISEATLGLTIFWFFITFGRFASDKIGKFVKLHQFIIASSSLAFLSYLMIFFVNNTIFDMIMIALMGLGYAGLYASILSYGIDQLSYNCPKLMSFLVLFGTIGGVLALPVSSYFVKSFNILTALLVGLIILSLEIIFIFLSLKDKKNRVKDMVSKRNLSHLYRFSRFIIGKYIRGVIDF